MPSESTTLRHGQLTVGTTPTLITTGFVGPSWLQLHAPAGGNYVYVGGSAVTASDGFRIEKGSVVQIWMPEAVSLYAIVASGTETLYWINTGGN